MKSISICLDNLYKWAHVAFWRHIVSKTAFLPQGDRIYWEPILISQVKWSWFSLPLYIFFSSSLNDENATARANRHGDVKHTLLTPSSLWLLHPYEPGWSGWECMDTHTHTHTYSETRTHTPRIVPDWRCHGCVCTKSLNCWTKYIHQLLTKIYFVTIILHILTKAMIIEFQFNYIPYRAFN